jgi:hypothetical protein
MKMVCFNTLPVLSISCLTNEVQAVWKRNAFLDKEMRPTSCHYSLVILCFSTIQVAILYSIRPYTYSCSSVTCHGLLIQKVS